MKRILALMVAGVVLFSSSISVCATSGAANTASSAVQDGSTSPSAEELKKEIEELKSEIEAQAKIMNEQTAQITKLVKEVQATADRAARAAAAAVSAPAQPVGAGSPTNDVRTQQLIRNNAVSYGNNVISQGGHVEINGGKSNVTISIGAPDSGTVSQANSLATNLKGTLLNCVTMSSPVAFNTAKVNFYMPGVVTNDNIAVYQIQNSKWVQVPTAEIRQDHVVVNLTKSGTLAFVRVPVLATVTG